MINTDCLPEAPSDLFLILVCTCGQHPSLLFKSYKEDQLIEGKKATAAQNLVLILIEILT